LRRREFVGGVLAAFCVRTLARAQSDRLYRIGWLDLNSSTGYLGAFEKALVARGWVKGQNFGVEYRGGEGRIERLAAVAAELVRLPVDAIVAPGATEAAAAGRATKSIPIVMAGVDDPVARGLVASLARPGRNITGVAGARRELSGKLLASVREITPPKTRVAVLTVSTDPDHRGIAGDLRAAARTMNVPLTTLDVTEYTDVEPAFAAIKRQGNKVLIVPASTMLVPRWIADLALTHGLALASTAPAYAYDGCLVVLTEDWSAVFDRVAAFVDKILKGARPADLPVETPAKFRLIVNTRTARALKLTLPQSLVARADSVID
jgi:putative tryptophan/tyrosine transport system substrate-binding protein